MIGTILKVVQQTDGLSKENQSVVVQLYIRGPVTGTAPTILMFGVQQHL